MTERTTGAHALLNLTWAYNLFQRLVGAEHARQALAAEFIQPKNNCRILDIGCGTAEVLPHLGDVDYTGFDPNPRYIEDAKRLYPNATLICSRVSGQSLHNHDPFDVILAMFVVHHLEDQEAVDLFKLAAAKLKPGGRLITIDPTYAPGQSAIARWILGQDRGQFIRDEPAYRDLAGQVFPSVKSAVRHDLLRIPYSHCIMIAQA